MLFRSTTPADEGTWTDLPGPFRMARLDSEWHLDSTQVPEGNRYFRVIASASGYVDRTSAVNGPWLVMPGFNPFRGFSYATLVPYQTGTGWAFSIVQSARVPDMAFRVQYSSQQYDAASWTDLPGGGVMTRQAGGDVWVHYARSVPSGQLWFRVIASAPDYADLASDLLGPFDVVPTLGGETVRITQSGRYSLQSFSGFLGGIGNFAVHVVGALVHLIVPEKTTTKAALTLSAEPGDSVTLTVENGQVLTSGGVNVGPNATAIVTGTVEGDMNVDPLISQDGGGLTGAGGVSLVGHEATTAAAIAAASLRQKKIGRAHV
mgnify:CR=1 FL=1